MRPGCSHDCGGVSVGRRKGVAQWDSYSAWCGHRAVALGCGVCVGVGCFLFASLERNKRYGFGKSFGGEGDHIV